MAREWLMSKRLWIGITIVGLIVAVHFSGIAKHVTLESLKEYHHYMVAWVDCCYIRSVLLYMAVYILVVSFVLPLAALMTLTGGTLFGAWYGALYANLAATVGGTLSFVVVRYVLGMPLQKKYAAPLKRFNHAIKQYGTPYLISIRFIAGIPFALINVLAGLTQISLWTFIWTTALGTFPGAVVFAYAGQELTAINALSDIFSWHIIVALGLLAVLAFVPTLMNLFGWKGNKV